MVEGFRNTSALVTGAQGFIGCWLAERLLDEGARVVVPRRSVEPRSRFRLEGIEGRCVIVDADVLDERAMARALGDHGVGLVFHLAAQPIVGIANRSPYSTWESNIRGTYALLEACRTVAEGGGETPRVVVASSDHAYGDHEAALPRGLRLQGPLPLRRLEGLRRHRRALVRGGGRAPGRGDPDGEHVRRRRPQLVADRARFRPRPGRRPPP